MEEYGFYPRFLSLCAILELSYILGANFRPESSNFKVIYTDKESEFSECGPYHELSATIPHSYLDSAHFLLEINVANLKYLEHLNFIARI